MLNADRTPLDKAMGRYHPLLPDLFQKLREGHTALPFEGDDPGSPLLHKEGSFLFLKRIFLQQSLLKEKICEKAKETRTASETLLDARLLDEQRVAIHYALCHAFTLLTGGPGTGKSFTIAALVKAWRQCYGQEQMIALAAPTGKATQHLRPALGDESVKLVTLQKLVKESYLSEDLIIVDEASMIDLPLMLALVMRLKKGAHLVLVGDPDQLPPVGFGQPFIDLLKLFPDSCKKLGRCMRSDRPEILGFAEAVRKQTMPDLQAIVWHQTVSRDLITTLYKAYELLLTASLEEALRFQTAFRALSPLVDGPFGSRALSQALFDRFAKKGEFLAPVIVKENDYEHGLYNGQLGVAEVADGSMKRVFFNELSFNVADLSSLELAYCISVHKAQGSEFDNVFLLLPPGSESFGKELLYTAATRAKKSLQLAASENQLKLSLAHSSRRVTGV